MAKVTEKPNLSEDGRRQRNCCRFFNCTSTCSLLLKKKRKHSSWVKKVHPFENSMENNTLLSNLLLSRLNRQVYDQTKSADLSDTRADPIRLCRTPYVHLGLRQSGRARVVEFGHKAVQLQMTKAQIPLDGHGPDQITRPNQTRSIGSPTTRSPKVRHVWFWLNTGARPDFPRKPAWKTQPL